MNNLSMHLRSITLAALLTTSPFLINPALAETSAASMMAPGMTQDDSDTTESTDKESPETQESQSTEDQSETGQEAPAEQAVTDESAKPADEAAPAEAAPEPEKEEPKPTTTEDLTIPADELNLLIKPFSTEELTLEASGWFDALHAKAKEVVAVELQVKRLNKKQIRIAEQLKSLEESEKPADTEANTTEDKKTDAADPDEEELTPEQRIDAAKALMLELNPEAETDGLDTPAALNEALGAFNSGLDEKKDVLNEKGAGLREQRTALIDNLNVVLDSINSTDGIQADGTDNDIVVPYRRYITTVTGLNIDVTDAESTTKVIKKWMSSKDGGKRWVKNISLFAGILFGFWILSMIVGALVGKALGAAKNSSALLRNFLVGITKKAIMIVGIVMALSALEINISPLLAALGAAGFILAFALQGTLSNFASGILMMIYRPFDIGDTVEAGGVSGSVESVNLVSTNIKTADNERTVVPNNTVWGGSITNSGQSTGQGCIEMSFMVSHADNADTVRERLETILANHPKVLKDPAPVVRLDELTDTGMKFVVQPCSLDEDSADVKWDVTREVKRLFDNKELTMPDA